MGCLNSLVYKHNFRITDGHGFFGWHRCVVRIHLCFPLHPFTSIIFRMIQMRYLHSSVLSVISVIFRMTQMRCLHSSVLSVTSVYIRDFSDDTDALFAFICAFRYIRNHPWFFLDDTNALPTTSVFICAIWIICFYQWFRHPTFCGIFNLNLITQKRSRYSSLLSVTSVSSAVQTSNHCDASLTIAIQNFNLSGVSIEVNLRCCYM